MEVEQDFEKTAMRVSTVSIVANFVLTVFKLAAGVAAHSGAMISDAIHSASDVFSTIVVMLGIRISRRASDKDHPYGHERLESREDPSHRAHAALAHPRLPQSVGQGDRKRVHGQAHAQQDAVDDKQHVDDHCFFLRFTRKARYLPRLSE